MIKDKVKRDVGFLTVPVPDLMAVTDESFYLIEHGADIVFPFDIDAVRVGAISRTSRTAILSGKSRPDTSACCGSYPARLYRSLTMEGHSQDRPSCQTHDPRCIISEMRKGIVSSDPLSKSRCCPARQMQRRLEPPEHPIEGI